MNYLPNRLRQTLPLWAGFTLFLMMLAPTGAHAQALSTWKTITDKQTGVSVLMPPTAKVNPDVKNDDASGAKFNLLSAEAKGTSSYYIFTAVRLNKAAIDALRASDTSGADPLDTLIDSSTKPVISGMQDQAKKDPKRMTVTSKPLAWMGMTGKEYTVVDAGTKTGKARYGIIRIVKSASSFYMLFGGETKRSTETDLRIHRFFDSFKILTPDPVIDKAPAVTPPAVTPPATTTPPAPVPPAAPTAPANPPAPATP